MATVNIPSTRNDPHYRYKMPRVITKVEGRGNGIKTCIVNMGEVARALMRPPQYTTKWLGSELGALSTYTNKEGEGERTLVNGFHEASVIQTFLDKFIDKYVCCKECHLPEIDMVVQGGNVMGKCKACGWLGELDNEHKMAAFIVKNPPDESGMNILTCGTGKKLSKEERRREKVRKQAIEESDESSWHSDSDEDGPEGSEGSAKDRKEKREYKEKREKRKEKKEKKEKDKKEKKEKKEKKGKLERERKGNKDEERQEGPERTVKEKTEGRGTKQGQEKEENEDGSAPKQQQEDSGAEDQCSDSDSEGTTITLRMQVADSTDEEHSQSETESEMSWWEDTDTENGSHQSTTCSEEGAKNTGQEVFQQ